MLRFYCKILIGAIENFEKFSKWKVGYHRFQIEYLRRLYYDDPLQNVKSGLSHQF